MIGQIRSLAVTVSACLEELSDELYGLLISIKAQRAENPLEEWKHLCLNLNRQCVGWWVSRTSSQHALGEQNGNSLRIITWKVSCKKCFLERWWPVKWLAAHVMLCRRACDRDTGWWSSSVNVSFCRVWAKTICAKGGKLAERAVMIMRRNDPVWNVRQVALLLPHNISSVSQ